MKTDLYLIRHGTTVWNQEKRLQGHNDIALHESGLKQAEDLAAYFVSRNQTFSHVYASNLQRASKTAEIISSQLNVPMSLSSDLRERHLGEWGGRTIEDIQENYPDWMEIRNKGGVFGIEGTNDLAIRMMKRIEQIAQSHLGEAVAVVSHGGAINSVLTHLTNGEHGIDKTVLENTSITHLQYDGEWVPVSIGVTPHLSSF